MVKNLHVYFPLLDFFHCRTNSQQEFHLVKIEVAALDKSHSQHPSLESKKGVKMYPLIYIRNSSTSNPFAELHSPSDEIGAAGAVVKCEGHVRVVLHLAVDHASIRD